MNTLVVPGTGDNLASSVGLGLLRTSDIAISLGTSDTLFAIINEKDLSVAEK